VADNAGDGNGGKMIAVHSVEIEQLTEITRKILDNQEKMFGVDGVCPKERAANAVAVSSMRTHIKGLWAAVTFIAGTLVTVVIEIVRKM